MLVVEPNNGLKARQGESAADPHTAAALLPLPTIYPVWFWPITFCLLAILKKSAINSSLYFSWKVKLLATRISSNHAMGRRKELFPRISIRLVPPEPLMLLTAPPGALPATDSV